MSINATSDELEPSSFNDTYVKPRTISDFRVEWDKIQKLPAPDADSMCDKWIVLTTINRPTSAVETLAVMDGWRVVVAGDLKTPTDWAFNNCVFLSVEQQQALNYSIFDILPTSSYSRKNIGYLYAIQHGAKMIYETDDDNELRPMVISPMEALGRAIDGGAAVVKDGGKCLLDSSFLPPTSRILTFNTTDETVNPYAHFGHSSIWPRGYPLGDIQREVPSVFVVEEKARLLIQQGLADGDPDVDAIFRLTRKREGRDIDVVFNDFAPPVALPVGTFCPFNSQNTVFHHDALWGMLIPVTTAFRVCDIWRGYWAQRLVWEVDGRLSFLAASVTQRRNPHDYMLDYVDEADLYNQTPKLVDFLRSWKSDSEHLFDRILELSFAMAEHGFWGFGDVELTRAWLRDLISVGYEPPKVTKGKKEKTRTLSISRPPSPQSHFDVHRGPSASTSNFSLSSATHPTFPSVLLLVNFNHAEYDMIGAYHQLHSRYFPNIFYYGQNASNVTLDDGTILHITAIDVQSGFYSFRCLANLIERVEGGQVAVKDAAGNKVEISGYLYTNDDSLLNTFVLSSFPLDQIWYTKPDAFFKCARPTAANTPRDWADPKDCTKGWWFRTETMDVCNSALNVIANESPLHAATMKSRYPNQERDDCYGFFSDFVYLPNNNNSLVPREFANMSKAFSTFIVFNEIAIPTMLKLIVDSYNLTIHDANVKYGWDDRDFFVDRFTTPIMWKIGMYHPLKLRSHPNIFPRWRAYMQKLDGFWVQAREQHFFNP